jgi:hypothetical protein
MVRYKKPCSIQMMVILRPELPQILGADPQVWFVRRRGWSDDRSVMVTVEMRE